MKRRRAKAARMTHNSTKMANSSAVTSNAHQDSEVENRQALVLFAIVLLFLMCNVPRIALNTYEVLTLDQFQKNRDNECFVLPVWVQSVSVLSLTAITINSSVNLLIYCVVNSAFRAEFLARGRSLRCSSSTPSTSATTRTELKECRPGTKTGAAQV